MDTPNDQNYMRRRAEVIFRLATRSDTQALIDLKHAINIAEHGVYPETTCIPAILDLSREAAVLGVEDRGKYRNNLPYCQY